MRQQYEDRGMLKCRGLILSEHAELLKQDKQKRQKEVPPLYLDEQQLEEMQRIVMESYYEQKPVVVQVNTFGLPYIEGTGVVTSPQSENGRLFLSDGSHCIKDIVSIKFADS